MSLDKPWKLILLKAYAKHLGGYNKVLCVHPFDFIDKFTDTNWKYFNLQRDGQDFLNVYHNKNDLGKFIAITKNKSDV